MFIIVPAKVTSIKHVAQITYKYEFMTVNETSHVYNNVELKKK